MRSQFGQFSSFDAVQLQEDGVIEGIKIGQHKIESIKKKCKYLFYEIKEDQANNIEGGYRVELSFEEQVKNFCGIGLGDNKAFKNNQSILSTFVITNQSLAEMRRVMATKCTANLSGTTFNVFKLVKLINTMKTKSQQYGTSPTDGAAAQYTTYQHLNTVRAMTTNND